MNPVLSLLGRKILLALGTYLVARGYLAPDKLEAWISANMDIVIGLGTVSFALALSFLDKLKNSIFTLTGKPKPLSKIQERIYEKESK